MFHYIDRKDQLEMVGSFVLGEVGYLKGDELALSYVLKKMVAIVDLLLFDIYTKDSRRAKHPVHAVTILAKTRSCIQNIDS